MKGITIAPRGTCLGELELKLGDDPRSGEPGLILKDPQGECQHSHWASAPVDSALAAASRVSQCEGFTLSFVTLQFLPGLEGKGAQTAGKAGRKNGTWKPESLQPPVSQKLDKV